MNTSKPELPSFHINPSQLTHMAVDLIKKTQTATKQLLDKLSPPDATFENVILSMAKIDNDIKSKVQIWHSFRPFRPHWSYVKHPRSL